MPPNKKTVPGPDGLPHEATIIGFREGGEHWNEYLLEDGTVLRLKMIVGEVVRIDDMYDGDGNPMYLTKAQSVVMVNAPDELRKK